MMSVALVVLGCLAAMMVAAVLFARAVKAQQGRGRKPDVLAAGAVTLLPPDQHRSDHQPPGEGHHHHDGSGHGNHGGGHASVGAGHGSADGAHAGVNVGHSSVDSGGGVH